MINSAVRRTVLIVGFTLSTSCSAFADDTTATKINSHSAVEPASTTSADIIPRLNNEFLDLYDKARNYEIEHCGPIVLIMKGKAVLIDGQVRQEVSFIPPQYHVLKTVDHTTLAVYVALKNTIGKNLSDDDLNNLKTLRQYAVSSQKALDGFSFSESLHNRQQKIMQAAITFIDKVIAKSSVSSVELKNFVREQTPLLMANANTAVAMELGNLDKQIQSWKKTMPAAKWNKVHVVICDEHMPRQDERYMQYFLKLFNEKQEGQRVIYQEGSLDENKALQLLGTHLLDTSIAKDFFGDPDRMHHDLLSAGTHKYLEQHLGQR